MPPTATTAQMSKFWAANIYYFSTVSNKCVVDESFKNARGKSEKLNRQRCHAIIMYHVLSGLCVCGTTIRHQG